MSVSKKSVGRILTSVILVVFVGYLRLNYKSFHVLLDINPVWLLLVAILDLVVISLNGLFIKVTLGPLNRVIGIVESFYVSLLSSVGNFFAPVGGGFGFRAVYLKRRHGLPYADFLATLSGNYIIVFLVNSFVALLALSLLHRYNGPSYWTLVLLFCCIFVASFLLTVSNFGVLISRLGNGRHGLFGKIIRIIDSIMRGWRTIVGSRGLLRKLIAITLGNFLISLIISKLEITALGYKVGGSQLLLFSVLGSLSLFINITPANLGIKEAIYIFSQHVIGFGTNQILLIALVDRGVLFAVLFLSWLLFGRRQLSEKGSKLVH